MAANLMKTNSNLVVWNRSPNAADDLVVAGARRAENARTAVAEADVIFTMLARPEAVEAVMLGPDGALSNTPKDSLWVDCSTVDPAFSQRCARAAEQRGIRFLGAPVAGTKPHAEGAQLTFFVGGSASDLEAVRPLLDQMGQNVLHLGDHPKGAAFKMLVNSLLAQSMLAFAETVLLGERMGLDRQFLLNVLPGLVVSAPVTKVKAEMIRSEDYTVQFPLELMFKDLHLATLAAYEHGASVPLASAAKAVYGVATRRGLARADFAAIFQHLEEKG